MDITKTETATFQRDVLESPLAVLVDFTAIWCGPCKMLEPVLQQLAQEWDGKARIVRLDIDENPDIPLRYQVMSVPTLILFVAGQPVQRLSGYQPKNRLVAKFSPHL